MFARKLLYSYCSKNTTYAVKKVLEGAPHTFHYRTMTGTTLKEVVSVLESIAPLKLAGSWDNVGLLVEPSAPHHVAKLMLTNDLTQPVLTESIHKECNFILSYHPPIFRALKRLRQSDVKERIVVQCIENRIAVFSPHTSYDAVEDGVCDWLMNACGVICEKEPITPTTSEDMVCFDVQLLKQIDSSKIPDDVKQDGALCYTSRRSYAAMNFDVPALKLHPLSEKNVGMGRKAKLETSTTLQNVINHVKKYIGMNYLRVALAENKQLDDMISTVACCAGAGSSVLDGCKVDLYLTGEMSHHEVLAATSQGISVILLDHSNSERGYLTHLKAKLSPLLPAVELVISETDKDPLEIM